jgi:hypothetical protein
LEIYQKLPPEAVQIVLVLFLSFLIGLEREERKATGGLYSFGGVRTFPLIGLIGSYFRPANDASGNGLSGSCRISASVLLAQDF